MKTSQFVFNHLCVKKMYAIYRIVSIYLLFFSFFLLRIFYFVVLLQLENGEWKGLE